MPPAQKTIGVHRAGQTYLTPFGTRIEMTPEQASGYATLLSIVMRGQDLEPHVKAEPAFLIQGFAPDKAILLASQKGLVGRWYALLWHPKVAGNLILLALGPKDGQKAAQGALEGMARLLQNMGISMDASLVDVRDSRDSSYECRVKDGYEVCRER